jgi:hypothetical protein
LNLLKGNPSKKPRVFSAEETAALLQRAQAGDIEARNSLITGNLGLIILAIHRNIFDDELKKDVFGELVFTAIDCIRRFDPNNGASFATFFFKSIVFKISGLKARARSIEKGFVSLDKVVNSDDPEGMTLADMVPDGTSGPTRRLRRSMIAPALARSWLNSMNGNYITPFKQF